uniref:helix-turn-helix domain-containing protein n=1 Tax=Enterococcus faecalis TaxID=1351 RepID=UPI00359C79CA
MKLTFDKEVFILLLDSYIEKDIIKKIKIINELWKFSSVQKKKMAKDLGISIVTVRTYVQALNEKFKNLVEEDTQTSYTIFDKHKKNKQDYLKELYKESIFIKACHYFLQTNFMQVEVFARENYLSFSKAYELRGKVIEYIKLLGIEPQNSLVPNNECKIRFLITYFQQVIGLKFVDILDVDKYRLNQLFKAIEKSEKCFFSEYSKEYASVLFQLHYKRNLLYPIVLSGDSKVYLEETPIYKRLFPIVKNFLEKEKKEAKEEIVTYFITVIMIMNTNYYHNYAVDELSKIFSNISKFLVIDNLVELFEKNFKRSLRTNIIFLSALIPFSRKCIFNLQRYIPEEHCEMGNIVAVPEKLVTKVRAILEKWNEEEQLELVFSEDHIRYFTSKLFFILNKRERTRTIYLLTSFYTDYLFGKEILNEEYSNRVTIKQFSSQKDVKSYDKEDLILYDTEYAILNQIHCKKLKITYIFDLEELQEIRKELFGFYLRGIDKK